MTGQGSAGRGPQFLNQLNSVKLMPMMRKPLAE